MKNIGIWINKRKHSVISKVREVYLWFKKRGINILLDTESAQALDIHDSSYSLRSLAKKSDCIMVWGGDGTILSCARVVAPVGTPIYGINAGRLGFLTEVDIPDLFVGIERLINGEYSVEERMMIQAMVYRDDEIVKELWGLNDAVISKTALARLIWLKLYTDGEFINTYPADGVIIASPTGSTAYSLSAGGPLVSPDLDLLVITPICPHTLSARPLVISPNRTVSIFTNIGDNLNIRGDIMLTVDGQCGYALQPGDEVRICRAPYKARFIKTQNNSFYKILRDKLEEWNRTHV